MLSRRTLKLARSLSLVLMVVFLAFSMLFYVWRQADSKFLLSFWIYFEISLATAFGVFGFTFIGLEIWLFRNATRAYDPEDAAIPDL
jgi:TRAP-type C4-dicarboxylate transport system permease small subunit